MLNVIIFVAKKQHITKKLLKINVFFVFNLFFLYAFLVLKKVF